jgi:hypothetical protein
MNKNSADSAAKVKNLKKRAGIKGNRPGFPICSSFAVNYKIHKAVAGLLTYSVSFQRLPARLEMDSGNQLRTVKELTAAGTVADLHGIPYYPFPEPMHGKSRKIHYRNARILY